MEMESHKFFSFAFDLRVSFPTMTTFLYTRNLGIRNFEFTLQCFYVSFTHRFRSRISRTCHIQFGILTIVQLKCLGFIYISLGFLRFGVSKNHVYSSISGPVLA